MNTNQNIDSTFRGSFLSCIGALFVAGSMLIVSCAGGFNLGTSLPFDIGLRYQVEEGLFIVAKPKDKGGLALTVEAADGNINEWVTKSTSPEGDPVWTITSPKTGAVYRVTQRATGRPLIEIVSGGNGRLQIVPTKEQPPIPAVEPVA